MSLVQRSVVAGQEMILLPSPEQRLDSHVLEKIDSVSSAAMSPPSISNSFSVSQQDEG